MAFEDFRKKLEDPKSEEHAALLRYAKGKIDKSREEMAKSYSCWDANDDVFRSRRKVDKEDLNSLAKGEPKKMIVPLTFSQVMTFVAFCVMSVTQNKRFFELEPTGTEDNPLDEPIELILERDLRRNQWTTFLVQFFLDVGRFSLAAGEVCYAEETRYMRIPKTETVEGPFGTTTEQTTAEFEPIKTFEGNRIYPVSPYRFFPDPGVPLSRYQEGEFCGSEDTFSLSKLKSLGPSMFNLDNIPKMNEEEYKTRRQKSRIDFGPMSRENPNLGSWSSPEDATKPDNMVKAGPVVVTKLVCDITPEYLEVGEKGTKLGDEKFPVRYLVWYANDRTIVRFEEFYALHGMFPYIAGQYLPDQHKNINEGLADICDQITNLITWKINAHVASQKNSVLSKFVIDPSGIDVKGLESRSPYIFTKKNAAQTGVERYIKQFTTQDVTANVLQDVAGFKDLLEGITGMSAQMQGQYSAGRRSATQDRVVAQGASARGKTHLGSIWDTAFEPLGKQMITNNRQEMDFETFERIMGKRTWPTNPDTQTVDPLTGQVRGVPYTTEEIFTMFKSTPQDLAMSEDFFVFDGTLPSEKAFLAQSLQEIFMTLMTNPAITQVLGFGPDQIRELFNQIYILRGVTPARLPAPTSAPAPSAVPPTAGAPQLSVVPSTSAATSGTA